MSNLTDRTDISNRRCAALFSDQRRTPRRSMLICSEITQK
jgi:hypothetical protein